MASRFVFLIVSACQAEKHRKTTPMYQADQMKNGELKLDVGADLEKFNELWQDIRFSAD